jgi:RHS repeat-associated protein
MDRVGSATQVGSQNVSFYPYGEDKGTAGANDNWKFGTYLRDSATGLDYAMGRYYSSGSGRFMSPDPYQASGGPAVPQSWNRYAYVQNDPINYGDPAGLLLTAEDCIADPDLCQEQDWGDNGGDGGDDGGGGGAPPSPLTCQFTGATIYDPGWGDVPVSGFGYHLPIEFNFGVTGGNGVYRWVGYQTVYFSGFITFTNGKFYNWSARPPLQEPPYTNNALPANSPIATFFDAPGQAAETPNGTTAIAVENFSYEFTAVVSSGGASVRCPPVFWMSSLTWINGEATGYDSVLTPAGATSHQ